MATEITIPYLHERIESLEKEKQQLLDRIAKIDAWIATSEETLKKITRIIGV